MIILLINDDHFCKYTASIFSTGYQNKNIFLNFFQTFQATINKNENKEVIKTYKIVCMYVFTVPKNEKSYRSVMGRGELYVCTATRLHARHMLPQQPLKKKCSHITTNRCRQPTVYGMFPVRLSESLVSKKRRSYFSFSFQKKKTVRVVCTTMICSVQDSYILI